MKSRKVTWELYNIISKIEPGVFKLTTIEEAWIMIMDYIGFECDVVNDMKKRKTVVTIYNKTDTVGEMSIRVEDVFRSEDNDWKWDELYKIIIKYIFDNKLAKKPRMKRSDKKKK